MSAACTVRTIVEKAGAASSATRRRRSIYAVWRCCNNADTRQWDTVTGRELAALKGGFSFALAFSPDGRTLARGDNDGIVTLLRGAADAEIGGPRFWSLGGKR
jgi:hypothetical protein